MFHSVQQCEIIKEIKGFWNERKHINKITGNGYDNKPES